MRIRVYGTANGGALGLSRSGGASASGQAHQDVFALFANSLAVIVPAEYDVRTLTSQQPTCQPKLAMRSPNSHPPTNNNTILLLSPVMT